MEQMASGVLENRARELYDPERHSQSKYLDGQDIGATALSYLCWALWHLGYVDQAAAVAAEATKRAEALSLLPTPFVMPVDRPDSRRRPSRNA
jgi:hypothetical protein